MNKPDLPTGFILAGGKSSRMGQDKCELKFGKKTFLQNAVDILEPICNQVIISGNNTLSKNLVLPDEKSYQGPAMAIFNCLRYSQTELNLVLACDLPLIPTGLFIFLLEEYQPGDLAIIPKQGELFQPLCGIYHKNFQTVLKNKMDSGEKKLQNILLHPGVRVVEINAKNSFFFPEIFLNINSPKDLTQLAAWKSR